MCGCVHVHERKGNFLWLSSNLCISQLKGLKCVQPQHLLLHQARQLELQSQFRKQTSQADFTGSYFLITQWLLVSNLESESQSVVSSITSISVCASGVCRYACAGVRVSWFAQMCAMYLCVNRDACKSQEPYSSVII